MFKRLRIAVLLYVLLFVAAAQFFAARRSTDWDTTLWINVYPLNGDGLNATQDYLDSLSVDEFTGIETFFAAQARDFHLAIDAPFRVNFATEHRGRLLPPLSADAGPLGVLWWSLRMRWLAARLEWSDSSPDADIVVFAVFHDEAVALDRSTALQRGLIAVANLFAKGSARGSNEVVLAHELLHTLGATDKYDLATNMPLFPDGFAAPHSTPQYPQAKAEIMAGRIPLSSNEALIPTDLRQAVVGKATAREIGWLER
jgi:hypothetical protein